MVPSCGHLYYYHKHIRSWWKSSTPENPLLLHTSVCISCRQLITGLSSALFYVLLFFLKTEKHFLITFKVSWNGTDIGSYNKKNGTLSFISLTYSNSILCKKFGLQAPQYMRLHVIGIPEISGRMFSTQCYTEIGCAFRLLLVSS